MTGTLGALIGQSALEFGQDVTSTPKIPYIAENTSRAQDIPLRLANAMQQFDVTNE